MARFRKGGYRHPGLFGGTLSRQPCRRCHRPILAGSHRGDPIKLDPQNLTQIGELNALLVGLQTYLHCPPNVLYRRHHIAITDEPRPMFGTIHRLHHCDKEQPSGASVAPERKYNYDEPGF